MLSVTGNVEAKLIKAARSAAKLVALVYAVGG